MFVCELYDEIAQIFTDTEMSRIKKAWVLQINSWDFPAGPVVKNPPPNAGGHWFNPWLGKIPRATGELSPGATAAEPAHLQPARRNEKSACRNEKSARRNEE